jgi:ABC-type polysaccharide/polyol phosphate transport system ATPase subunit
VDERTRNGRHRAASGVGDAARLLARRAAAEGSVVTRGVIAPLIELSGGFNFELTGRENIFLHGAIMGRSRRNMQEKLQGIIEFADLGDFIDAPLATYSSGMRARLAFAVATDVDPDILLLDEVLSVGDAAFAAKCADRIEGFFKSDRTVITVSHSTATIKQLCTRAVYLRGGRVVCDGTPDEVIARYNDDVARDRGRGVGQKKVGS